MTNRTIYVALEGALLSVPKAYLKIGKKGDVIVVPISVVNNLYHFTGVKKVFACEICDYLSRAKLDKEFEQENGTFIRIMNPDSFIPDSFKVSSTSIVSENKQKILELCKRLPEIYKDSNVVLLSQNPVSLLYASNMGIQTQAISDKIFPRLRDRYTGISDLDVSLELFNEFTEQGKVKSPQEFHPNEFVCIHDPVGGSKISHYSNGYLEDLHFQLAKNFTPRNIEQTVLTECLYAPPSVAPLVIVSGVAGTGKTFTTVHVAMNQMQNNGLYAHDYQKLIISTPAVTDIGESLGYLPGDIIEKFRPYLGGVIDALIKIINEKNKKECGGGFGRKKEDSHAKEKLLSYLDFGLIEIQPLGFLAGHSFENCFVIVDEAQNIDPNFFINIVTRMSKGSKLVILGDPYQVKAPELSRKINGIIYMMEVWKDEPLAWQIQMNSQKSVRSELCQRAIELMS